MVVTSAYPSAQSAGGGNNDAPLRAPVARGHQLDAVQRLDAPTILSASSTRPSEDARHAITAGVAVLDTQAESGSGGALDRTGDLGIMSPFDPDSEEPR
jgi:hypothetical protein